MCACKWWAEHILAYTLHAGHILLFFLTAQRYAFSVCVSFSCVCAFSFSFCLFYQLQNCYSTVCAFFPVWVRRTCHGMPYSRWVRNCVYSACYCYGKFCREFKIVSFLRKLILQNVSVFMVWSLRFHGALCLCRVAYEMGHANQFHSNCTRAHTHIHCSAFTERRERALFFILLLWLPRHIKFLINVNRSQKKKAHFCMFDHCRQIYVLCIFYSTKRRVSMSNLSSRDWVASKSYLDTIAGKHQRKP